MALKTLANARDPLAGTREQRSVLAAVPLHRSFASVCETAGGLRAGAIDILQINVGRRCNQACRHCHVDAGPDRTEVMPRAIVDACLHFLDTCGAGTLDITGGAPELHPQFREIVTRARALGRRVIDRCNLTITTLPNYSDIPDFLARHQVDIVASLPSYAPRSTDAQRGDGVFDASLTALRRLNELGYGIEGTGLVLNLVTNPVGAFLPPPQAALEREWKRELHRRFGVSFSRLFTITNMPISRYLQFLVESGNLDTYLQRLVDAFNPAALDGLMCRNTLSVGWDGRLFDCDFNQMLDLSTAAGYPQTIAEASAALLRNRPIVVGPHCFGCTAGAGSSCGGAIQT